MTVKVPLRAPKAVGVKVTLTVQLAFGASCPPMLQSFVCAKSPLVPIAEIVDGALPALVICIRSGALVVPIPWLPKG